MTPFFCDTKTSTMSKQTFIFLLFSFAALSCRGQYLEAGIGVGATNYIGELQSQIVQPSEYNLAISAFGRYNISPRIAASMHLSQGKISGKDSNATLIVDQSRNLSFRSDIIELGITGEFNLVPYHIPDEKIASPYIFAGVAGFYFNPQAQIRGEWKNLQPLGTEGQGLAEYQGLKKYNRFQLSIPFGLGFKFSLSKQTNLGIRFGVRKTFTDYLDDVSGLYPDLDLLDPEVAALTYREPENSENFIGNPVGLERGDPTNDDWYMIGTVTISFNLTNSYGLDFEEKYQIFKDPLEQDIQSDEDF